MAQSQDTIDTAKVIVLTGFAITGLLMVLVVGTCSYLWIVGKDLPKELGLLLIAVTTYAFTTIPQQISRYTDRALGETKAQP